MNRRDERSPPEPRWGDDHEQRRVARLLTAYWTADPEATWRRIDLLQRSARTSARQRTADAVMGRLGYRRRRRRRRLAVLTVIAVAAAGFGVWTTLAREAEWHLAPAGGARWLTAEVGPQAVDSALPGVPGVLEVGDRPVQLYSADGLVATVAAGTRLRWSASSGPREGPALLAGRIEWAVSPRDGAWTVATPLAHVAVLGTRFTLAHDVAGTRVALHEGSLRVTRSSDAASRLLSPGERLRVAEGPAPLRVVTATDWYVAVAEHYTTGRFMLEDAWRSGPTVSLPLDGGEAGHGVALDAGAGEERSWTGPALPDLEAFEVRFAFGVDAFHDGAFCNLYGMGTGIYEPSASGLPEAWSRPLDATLGWREHRVRLLQVGEDVEGVPIFEVEARIDDQVYVRGWREGRAERVLLAVRSCAARIRDLTVAPLLLPEP